MANKTLQDAIALVTLWGATSAQSARILPESLEVDEAQTRVNLLFSIHECLQLLVREEQARNRYMMTKNNGLYFEGRKPLEIIASGDMQDLKDVHMRIRNMICI